MMVACDVASFIRKATYCVRISVRISSNAVLTVASLLNTGARPNPVNKNFLQSAWRKSLKTIRSPPLRPANCEVGFVEVIVPLFVRMANLTVLAWFGVVQNLAVDVVLGTSFIDRCI